MRARRSDWLRLGLSVAGYALVTILISLMMNLTGDCGPEVENCGETARQLSFVALAVGVAWIGYIIVRFVRKHGQ